MLAKSSIAPEHLPPEEDIKKLERRITSTDKKLVKETKKFPKPVSGNKEPESSE